MTIGGISVSCYIKSSRFSPKNSSAFPASSLSCNTKERVIILKILKKSVIKIYKKNCNAKYIILDTWVFGGPLYHQCDLFFKSKEKYTHTQMKTHIFVKFVLEFSLVLFSLLSVQ